MWSRLPADQLPGSPASVPTAAAHGAVPPGSHRRWAWNSAQGSADQDAALAAAARGKAALDTAAHNHPAPYPLTSGSTPQPVRPVRGFHW